MCLQMVPRATVLQVEPGLFMWHIIYIAYPFKTIYIFPIYFLNASSIILYIVYERQRQVYRRCMASQNPAVPTFVIRSRNNY